MELARLVDLVSRVQSTTKKTEKISLIADFLKQTHDKETDLAAFYLAGTLPQGKIGIGWRMIEEAMPDASLSAEPLTLIEIDRAFESIASLQGPGSLEQKTGLLRRLFERTNLEESRFLGRLIMGELRQGALEGLVLEAIAKAAQLPSSDIRQAWMFSGNIGEIARIALEEGSSGLSRFGLRLFTPISPMLANSADDIGEALERLGKAAFEFKIDGGRVQIHKGGDEIKIFTRQLQEVTERLPEIVEWSRALPVREIILEGEAIGLRPDQRPQPFQTTMRRFGRIKEVEAMRKEIPLTPFFFDCLHLEGEGSLLQRPYRERYEILTKAVPGAALLPRIVTDDTAQAEKFFNESLAAGHEGLMAKSLTAPYTAGQRGFSWLKLKAAKTLDLVILAAEWGSGRRHGWLSNLHLGARDPETGQFIMLGKTFKGLTDEMLKWQTEKLLSLEARRDDWTVYVRPELVVEIAFNDVQQSPRYPAGMALRFARVKRHRPDKPTSETDTIQTVAEIFRKQRE